MMHGAEASSGDKAVVPEGYNAISWGQVDPSEQKLILALREIDIQQTEGEMRTQIEGALATVAGKVGGKVLTQREREEYVRPKEKEVAAAEVVDDSSSETRKNVMYSNALASTAISFHAASGERTVFVRPSNQNGTWSYEWLSF